MPDRMRPTGSDSVARSDGGTGRFLSRQEATSTYARQGRLTFRAGRKWLYVGTSITNGSTASNTIYAYPTQSLGMAGTWYASSGSVIAGTPGQVVSGNLAALPGLLTTNSPDAVFIEVGPNDSSDTAATTLASFQASVSGMVALAKAAGLPVVVTTPSPRAASIATTTTRLRTNQFAQWIRLWGQSNGVAVADFHATLIDPTTGDLSSSYDSGDGIHPNDAGHSLLAQVASSAMLRVMGTGMPTPVVAAGLGLATNPLLVTANSLNPTGSVSATATGTAPTQTMETADATGRRPAGNWAVQTLVAGAATVYARALPMAASGWAVGDSLAICGYVEVTDNAARWPADVIAGNAQVRVQVRNQIGTVLASSWDRTVGRPVATGVYAIGPSFRTFTVPAGTTSMDLLYTQTQPNGASVVIRYATLEAINLTALGLTA